DVDTGSDDAVAIMEAVLSKGIELLAVCTVWGNVPVENTTENTLRVLQLVGSELPVYKGAPQPMVKHLSRNRMKDGRTNRAATLGEKTLRMHPEYLELPPSRRGCEGRDAVSYYIETLRAAKEPVTLVACGPMTNVGLALTIAPDIVKNIEEIVLMGGGCYQANCTACAESNIWHDPEAAQALLQSGAKVTIVPLDATHRAALTKEHCKLLRAVGTPAADFAAEMAENRMVVYNQTQPLARPDLSPLHDPLCIAYLIDPEVLTDLRPVHCEVDCGDGAGQGQTIVDPRYFTEEKNSYFAFDADVDRFVSILCDVFRG
ncbi:nucleoside hydrolase, partial [Akkermansia muciniphila]|uniref:nucleoside hydrolase n=1 Tax=Akkermansia muciniphila TaxID=239935 RepID=UPI00122F8641